MTSFFKAKRSEKFSSFNHSICVNFPILEEMRTIRCIEHDNRRKFITPFVGGQVVICDAFGFEIPEGCRPTYISTKSNNSKRGRPAKL